MFLNNEINTNHSINPIWALLAIPAMIMLLGSDAGNNLSIVSRFASGELSLWSWQGLALGAAISSAPLGYGTSRKRWLVFPCILVCFLGGILTVMSTNTDFAAKSSGADQYLSTYEGLIAERSTLLESLNPSDGSLPCSKQRWCNSAEKEARVAEINLQLTNTNVEVDPLATPNGEILALLIAYLRAFGVPLIIAALAHLLGLMFHGKVLGRNFAKTTTVKGNRSEKNYENFHRYKEKNKRETSMDEALERSRSWLLKQQSGRISKTELKVVSRAKGHKMMAAMVQILLDSGDLVRYENGQLAKPTGTSLRAVN